MRFLRKEEKGGKVLLFCHAPYFKEMRAAFGTAPLVSDLRTRNATHKFMVICFALTDKVIRTINYRAFFSDFISAENDFVVKSNELFSIATENINVGKHKLVNGRIYDAKDSYQLREKKILDDLIPLGAVTPVGS